MNAAFKQRRARIGILTFALAGLFGFAVLRLIVLVVFDGARLNSLARNEHTGATESGGGARSDCRSQRRAVGAVSRDAFGLCAAASSLSSRPRPLSARSWRRCLMMMPIDLETRLGKHAPFVWLERRIAPAKRTAVEALGIDGIGTISEYKRFYPESNLAASVVGLAGMDGQGLSGLELEYDRLARGEPVELQFYHDALGHPIFDSPLALKAPEPGRNSS